MNEEFILEMISEAILRRDSPQFEESTHNLGSLIISEADFPDKAFTFILNLLNKDEFLMLDSSHELLQLFNFCWAVLSEKQKQILLPALTNAYGNLTDWISWFVISELLGEYYNNESAFEALQKLKESSVEGARSLVPHGFEHLATSTDISLARRAHEELLSMTNDRSAQVRNEASLSLQRLR